MGKVILGQEKTKNCCANAPNNATSRITKGRQEREHTNFNEVRYKYLRCKTQENSNFLRNGKTVILVKN